MNSNAYIAIPLAVGAIFCARPGGHAQTVFNDEVGVIGASGTTPRLRITQASQGTWSLAEPAGTNSFSISQGGGLGIEYLRILGGAPYAGNVGLSTTSPRGRLEVFSDMPSLTSNLMLSSGQDRTPRIRFNGPWSVSNASESYAQIVAINDHGGPGTSSASLHFYTSSGDPALLVDRLVITGQGNVGINQPNPQVRLHVGGGVGYTGMLLGTESGGAYLRWSREGRSADNNQLNIYDQDTETVVATFKSGGNVGIGTTSPSHKLSVNGTGKFKEVIVETSGWSDYVLAPDYELQSLSEVEAHIKEHQHLPGIPSASEITEQGVSVGEMQAKLLAKIEELTLHVIAQQKLLAAQEARIRSQDEKIARLSSIGAEDFPRTTPANIAK